MDAIKCLGQFKLCLFFGNETEITKELVPFYILPFKPYTFNT